MEKFVKWTIGAVFAALLYQGIIHLFFGGCDPKINLSCDEQAGIASKEDLGRKPLPVGRQRTTTGEY